ncbi:MAG: acyltransferase [Desulforegulaceae bacterium]|nr:acyltransferase [Desulforegulaceae bacterium]
MVENYFVHESSYVDDNCKIGENAKIWHFCHILKNTTIGNNTSLGQNVVAGPNVKIGSNCKIQNNVSVYNGVEIEDGVFCGPSCVFTNVINPRAFIEKKDEFKNTLLKKGCSIGANATIICGITIGKYALIAAGAVVNKNVSDFALMAGVPAKQIGWVCRCGETLKFESEYEIKCLSCNTRYLMKNNTLCLSE